MANPVIICCQMCRRTYTLGADAVVVPPENILLDAISSPGGFTFFGKPYENSPNTPDLVAPLEERNWRSLEPEELQRQEVAIRIISVSLSKNKQRWGKCYKCNTVQTYQSTIR